MSPETIAKAVQRVRTVLSRHPAAGIHADDPAVARWGQDLRVVCTHANGTQIATDLPTEMGGTGPRELRLEVRLGASGVPCEKLQAIIDDSHRCSPVSAALVSAVPIALHVEIDLS